MATEVILPALGMAQETGKIVQWLKAEGEQVKKGQPIAEIETDKATVELESPSDGVLSDIRGAVGDDVPVGQVIARILAPGELAQGQISKEVTSPPSSTQMNGAQPLSVTSNGQDVAETNKPAKSPSRLASRIADEYKIDLNQVTPAGRRIQKADVLTYLQNQQGATPVATETHTTMASPKARRLASEQGKDLGAIKGTGPGGAVLAADVVAAVAVASTAAPSAIAVETTLLDSVEVPVHADRGKPSPDESRQDNGQASFHGSAQASTNGASGSHEVAIGTTWRIMAERTTQSWTNVPHFFLTREVRASRLISWRTQILKRSTEKVTYTDLLVKIVATALRAHPRLNATWRNGTIVLQDDVNVGLAAAVEEGLVVPVIHQADELSLNGIAQQRKDLVNRAQAGKLRPQDLQGGTFTISNLGMYGVDAFNAIINAPQAAILAVGQMVERVVPVDGQPSVQPMMMLTLSCDHRVVDGARGAQFLAMVAELIEEPLGIIT